MMRERLIILLFLFFCYSQGLKVSKVEVPRFVLVGESTTLKCHFTLEGEKLYSLKWWKDDRQFYQYIPRNEPKMVVFEIPGISVNRKNSGIHSVELIELQLASQGQFRCEVVAEAPTFTTHMLGSNLTVIDPPDGPPVVRGQKPIYHPGEIITLNCTSYRSQPLPHLQWEILKYNATTSTPNPDLRKTPKRMTNSLSPLQSLHVSSLAPSSPYLLPSSSSRNHHNTKIAQSFFSSLWDQLTSNSLEKSSRGLKTYYKRNRMHRMAPSNQRLSSPLKTPNYSLVNRKHLMVYPPQSSGETNSDIHSLTLGIQYPATLKDAPKGEISFRCSSIIHTYRWATEVVVGIAEVPVADPQQLPTLHDTGAARGTSVCCIPNLLIIIIVTLLQRR